MNSINELTRLIQRGNLDAQLDVLSAAIRSRRDTLSDLKAATLRASVAVGDKLYFSSTVRPAYLAGAEVIVVRLKRKKVEVDLVTPVGRFAKRVTCPATLLVTTKGA